mgnify:CR=1 FL=1
MKFYWNKRKTDYYFVAIELKKRIPELKSVDVDYIESNLMGTGLEFYRISKKEVPLSIRLTLPFAIITFIVLFVTSPIKFMITGKWGYSNEALRNWFNSLGM